MSMDHHGAVTVVFADRLSARIGKETLIVTGSPRGGTSAIAYALRRFGYFLGDRLGRQNHEDRDILEVFESASRRKRKARFARIVAERNGAHERWGFKLPKAALQLAEIAAATREPVAVIVYRNPLAVGRSIIGRGPNFPKGPEGLLKAVVLASERMAAAAGQVLEAGLPALLIDFDQFRADPRGNLAFLVERLGLDVDGGLLDDVAGTISEPGYKRIQPA